MFITKRENKMEDMSLITAVGLGLRASFGMLLGLGAAYVTLLFIFALLAVCSRRGE